ncbi:MAG TPA: tryptophan synthase subunit alpha [Solirubrobacteraceae bacterium]|nr:tryptophan synthase subunit alpha [Solirubrobacteraceae bacterium]
MSATTPQSGVARLAEAFAARRRPAALMPYVMGGFPTLADSLAIARACIEVGADVIELGVPYSDPLADGPVIQAAGARALAGGADLAGVLEVARAIAPEVPVVVMAYANMVLAPGAQRFLERLRIAGASGLIVPDLPLEESGRLRAIADALGIALVPLIAPTTPQRRLAQIAACARGFLYLVSVTGTTGERSLEELRYAELIAAARPHTQLPLALGFGIASAEHARAAVQAGAEGVVIGSRLVRAAEAAERPAEAVAEVLARIAEGLVR